jgi:Domain of unknown function (DUF4405)
LLKLTLRGGVSSTKAASGENPIQKGDRMQIGKKFTTNKLNLFLDMALVLIFVVEMEVHFTGVHYHELLGLMISAVLAVHITLHWQWVVGVVKELFRKLFSVNKTRLKYTLNLILFIDIAVCIVTGILISRTLGLNFTFSQQISHGLHTLSAQLSLILVGLHIATSWEWIAFNTKKYLFNFAFLQKQAISGNHLKDKEESIEVKVPTSR